MCMVSTKVLASESGKKFDTFGSDLVILAYFIFNFNGILQPIFNFTEEAMMANELKYCGGHESGSSISQEEPIRKSRGQDRY